MFYGNPGQLVTQIIAVVVVAAYSFIATLIIGKVIDIIIGLRVEEKEELEGLDINQHEETGYRI